MAWFTFECPKHGQFRLGLEKRAKAVPCFTHGCMQVCSNVVKTGSISVVESLDNGAMARKVERLHNIEEIMNDRADKHSSENEE